LQERETEIGNRIGVCDLGGFCHFFFLKREESDKKKPTFLLISIQKKTFFFKKFFFFGLISCGFDFEGAFVA
jgi:hypothetical protein